nr:MAG TPA: hypothetical protein [Caudoviricetes sp.]
MHCKRLFYADHKDSAFDFSMMIHCKALLTMFVFSNRITSAKKNQPIQYPEPNLSHYHCISARLKNPSALS